MARAASKKQPKATTSSTASQSKTIPASSSIPEPFVPSPAQLRPLTSTLPTDHVFTVHIDSNPSTLKKRVYIVPVLLNLAIAGILCIRIYFAAPIYLDQIITIFGYETAWKVKPETMSYQGIINEIIGRTGLLMMDYAIFAFVGSWPWEFVFGSKYSRHTGPWAWRRNVGFREVDIVVRRGRKWDDILFKPEDKIWSREDELLIQATVQPAMTKSYTSKTGYLLLDKNWDLDFRAMIDAHQLMDKEKLALKDLDHIVLVHYRNQWLVWRVHEDSERVTSNPEDDAQVHNFREKLKSLGREDVFFRWIEIVQYETSLPGGLTQARRDGALQELRKLLTERKIDYTKFMEEIGGTQAVPGLNSG